jgi:hypothetical protein
MHYGYELIFKSDYLLIHLSATVPRMMAVIIYLNTCCFQYIGLLCILVFIVLL